MKNFKVQAVIAGILSAHLSLVSAATPAIGVAFSNGTLLINNASTVGNASLFDGSTVETNSAASRLHLKSGADVQMASDSRGKVFSNRLVLEKGVMELKTAGKYGIEARSLQITGTDSDATAKVSIHGKTVQVASLSGHLQVASAAGVVVANIAPGMAFDFTPQDQGASAPKPAAGAAGAGAAGAGAAAGGAAMSTTAITVAVVVGVAAVATTAGVLAFPRDYEHPDQRYQPWTVAALDGSIVPSSPLCPKPRPNGRGFFVLTITSFDHLHFYFEYD